MNIALNAYFIPRFGYIAAAYTTVVCYLLYYAIHVFFAWKVHGGILYDMKNQLLWLFGVTAAAFIFLAMTELIWLRMALLAILCLFALLAAVDLALTIIDPDRPMHVAQLILGPLLRLSGLFTLGM